MLAIAAGVMVAFPLGLAYSYLIKWTFTHPDHIAALKNGDIAPLDQARPRVPPSGRFARLTLKYSRRCDDFCALSIANVTVTLDKDGKPEEQVDELMSNLWVPKTMFDYLAQFDHPTARVSPGV